MGERLASPVARRAALAAGLLAWILLCLWCARGTPPGVDLPAHAAQMQSLASLLEGRAELSSRFEAHFVPGYGLVTWLVAPVAIAFHGAGAARVALFLSMAGLLPAMALLLRALRQPVALCFLAAPFGFSFAYWYGFLPELFARTCALLALAAWVSVVREHDWKRELLAAALLAVVALSHLLTFGMLVLGAVALAVLGPRPVPVRALRALLPGLAITAWSVVSLRGSLGPGVGNGWRWDGAGHALFFLRNYQEEGRAGLVASLVLFVLCLLSARRRGTASRVLAVVAVWAMVYVLCPRDLGAATLLCYRLPALIGLLAVCAAAPLLRSTRRLVLATVCLVVALGQVVAFHVLFRDEVAGLVSVARAEASRGTVLLAGPRLPWTRFPYLEHFGEWITAREGGLGTHFFADAAHQPVHARASAPAAPDWSALYVYGKGGLPFASGKWCLQRLAFQWRRYQRDCPLDGP